MRSLGSIFLRFRAGGMSSPASCEGGGVKSRQPGGGEGERGDERGELGGDDSSDVKLEMSDMLSMLRLGMLAAAKAAAAGARVAARLAACGKKRFSKTSVVRLRHYRYHEAILLLPLCLFVRKMNVGMDEPREL